MWETAAADSLPWGLRSRVAGMNGLPEANLFAKK